MEQQHTETVVRLHTLFLQCHSKICTDTRKIEPGSIFFALKGGSFDGNKFIQQALDAGCAYAVADDPGIKESDRIIKTTDVLRTLQELSNYHRRQFKIPVLAITGSNGKTTTKELIHAVLSKKYKTLATEGNLNNHIGVPLTLLRLKAEHEFAIIEMGANHQGEIRELCKIAEPGYGTITNIGKAHLEGFGGIEGVKKGKGELYDYLYNTKGIVFVNSDDFVLHEMVVNHEKISYGTTKLYDVVGKAGTAGGMLEFKWKTRYTASSLSSAPFVKSHLVGNYNLNNLLCAAAVGNYFHVEESLINEALSSYVPSNNRSQLFQSEKNNLVLDMYNANPSSMEAAIENFSQRKEREKLLILGDMLELGDEAGIEHEQVLNLAKKKNFTDCICVGPEFYKLSAQSGFTHFKHVNEAAEWLKQQNISGKTILVKGSRGIKLEELVSLL